jgi:hypothetical protein
MREEIKKVKARDPLSLEGCRKKQLICYLNSLAERSDGRLSSFPIVSRFPLCTRSGI